MIKKITGVVLIILSVLIMMSVLNQIPVVKITGDKAYDIGYIVGHFAAMAIFAALAIFLFIKGRKMVRATV